MAAKSVLLLSTMVLLSCLTLLSTASVVAKSKSPGGLSFIAKQLRAAKRCEECDLPSDCQDPLVCTDGTFCETEDDSYVCEDTCCVDRCDCSDTKNCVVGPSGPCTFDCQCLGNFRCVSGTCQVPITEPNNRCERCETNGDCKEEYTCKGEKCVLDDDPKDICGSFCCLFCTCKDGTNCRKPFGAACSEDCECMGDEEKGDDPRCFDGVCVNKDDEVPASASPIPSHTPLPTSSNTLSPPTHSPTSTGTRPPSPTNSRHPIEGSHTPPPATHSGRPPTPSSSNAPPTTSASPTAAEVPSDVPTESPDDGAPTVFASASLGPSSSASGTASITPTSTPDCYPADGVVELEDGNTILVQDLKAGDFVFDGLGYTRVIINVNMKKGSDVMMYVNGKAIATQNHAGFSGLLPHQYQTKSHDSVYLIFTESRYIQVHGVRVSNFISTYPVWLQELGIRIVQQSSMVREVVMMYRPSQIWHDALCRLVEVIRFISYPAISTSS